LVKQKTKIGLFGLVFLEWVFSSF